MTDRQPTADAMASRVRGNTFNAAIAAAFLLYFGFAVILEPTGTGLFERSGQVFYHTLRIGGVAMAIVAGASLSGHPIALLLDAIAAAIIGALLILTGGGMMAGGGGFGLQTVITILCGLMFLSSARHAWADFSLWKTGGPTSTRDIATPTTSPVGGPPASSPVPPVSSAAIPGSNDAPLPPEPVSLAGQLRDQRRAADAGAPPVSPAPSARGPTLEDAVATAPGSLSDVDWSDQPRDKEATGRPPDAPADTDSTDQDDGGFLASFADEGPPPKP